ncbi:CmcJ/NvfI family oxidoreductase [Altericroceibacterium endophyticum]|uniref:Methyltransferase n=1 Tax=Altericroceibacterium endophyticum TaxID=1808508 RepID=A0A6I4T4V2_9SPHN|nr:CmcJ/NvfI family oxidoreductase [Altericroceibacterium endophyticum]MXO64705.1 hypothetical protein [Altericroceibacterium endophyticum]
MATQTHSDIEDTARTTQTMIRYLAPGDFVTRRYVSQGEEMNTGEYADYEMSIRDGMPIRDHFELDKHGFMLAKSPTKIADFHDKEEVTRVYERETEQAICRLTGADKAVARGWMIRTSLDLSDHIQEKSENYQHSGGVQPPAGEAHIDFNRLTAQKVAEATYKEHFPDGPGFKRFIATSFWRTFSPGPQDVPLAVCDGRSAPEGNEAYNTLFVVDEFPEGDALTAPVEGEDQMIAATIFRYDPQHRWWYFSDMNKDDVLFFKFYDSDESTTWRCPHTAFRDSSFSDAKPRESIEVRSIAFFE